MPSARRARRRHHRDRRRRLRHAAPGRRAAARATCSASPRERLLHASRDAAGRRAGACARFQDRRAPARACEREPVAYILGTPRLPPPRAGRRPRACSSRARRPSCSSRSRSTLPAGARVLDLGTGSGAVALALKRRAPRPAASPAATSARTRSSWRAPTPSALGLDVSWLHADLLAGVPDEFDAVVSNPPYVAECERAALAPEIVRHEPPGALFAGPRRAGRDPRADRAGRRARARVRMVALEIGAGQARPRRGADARRGLRRRCAAERDLAGIERGAASASERAVTARPRDAEVAGASCVARGRRRRVPRRHRLRGRLRSRRARAAVARLYELKGRPPAKPAAVMFFALEHALAALPELQRARARRARRRCCPGPLTLLLPNRGRRFPLACGPTRDTLGLRVPRCRERWPRCAACECRCCSRAPTSPAGPTRARWREVPAEHPRRRRPGARRRRAARHAVDGGRPAGYASASSRCARARWARGEPRLGAPASRRALRAALLASSAATGA